MGNVPRNAASNLEPNRCWLPAVTKEEEVGEQFLSTLKPKEVIQRWGTI